GTFHIFSDNTFINPELSNITGMAQEKGLADVICQQDVIFLKKYLFPAISVSNGRLTRIT
ncbi:hypothetical protein, partial [Escherichia coli]|uniref:hypothetical protein n=1 Tax=Escherichia coli TaxID=562 RepID=UPI000B10FBB9